MKKRNVMLYLDDELIIKMRRRTENISGTVNELCWRWVETTAEKEEKNKVKEKELEIEELKIKLAALETENKKYEEEKSKRKIIRRIEF
jgi:predicted nuclease with TOPRIM domain